MMRFESMKACAESFEFAIPISYGTTEAIETGKWGFQKPETIFMAAPCEESCPAANPIARFIYLAGQGQYKEAVQTILRENPFPGVCGRVCFHPCEVECNRAKYDESISINDLERFVFDVTADQWPELQTLSNRDPKKIAIVGGGPAGLSCAYFLALLGHKATLFEAREELGGVLRWGIPEYRLPKQVLKREVARILRLGMEVKTGVEVGKKISFEELNRFDAIFLSPGAGQSMPLGVEGENLGRVWKGKDFLNRIHSAERFRVGKEVIVVGGGNTAMDVARSARRFGSSVTVVYRRTKKEMPAIQDEIEGSEAEGVRFQFLLQPIDIRVLKNRKIRVKFQQMRLRRAGPLHRPQPVPVQGSFITLEADRLITAVGERVDLSWVPRSLSEEGFLRPGPSLVAEGMWTFAGGDAVDQQRSVVTAISAGKRAAILIDLDSRGHDSEEVFSKIGVGSKGALSMEAYLQGREKGHWEEPKGVVPYDRINTLFFEPLKRVKEDKPYPDKIPKGFSEVHAGFSSDEAHLSASRCFSCGTCNYCYNCYYFCPEGVVSFNPVDGTRMVDFEHCKGCGTCSTACPRHVVEMR